MGKIRDFFYGKQEPNWIRKVYDGPGVQDYMDSAFEMEFGFHCDCLYNGFENDEPRRRAVEELQQQVVAHLVSIANNPERYRRAIGLLDYWASEVPWEKHATLSWHLLVQ